MPSVAPGSSMRDSIAALLRFHYSRVEVEVRVGATTADVLYVDDTQPIFPRRIAVESKDWAKSLTSGDISSIYQLYFPSLSSREIDNLWIIGRHTLAGSPRQTLDALPNVAYTTFDQFQASLINFNPLLQHNISVFEQDDSFGNFVTTRSRQTNTPLLDSVREWLDTDKTGLVIYGGYGLGKTTFSKYLAHTLSVDDPSGVPSRIPIRFTLGDIYYKQDVISLISSALAGGETGVAVKNFSYTLFLEMNRRGKLLLIFDGFDEMRHAIELDDFVYNFRQMRSLLSGQAKVIILGRPDAFLSSTEETKVFSSLFDTPQGAAANLDLLEVGFFDNADIAQYLEGFMAARDFSDDKREKVGQLLSLMSASDNILSRPVQLKMFTSVIDDFIDDTTLPTRYKLYESFIYSFISREQNKSARELKAESKQVAQDARARFMQNAAWWILSSKKENRFIPSEITRNLVPADIAQRHGNDAAVREALLGSVIEPMDHSGVLGKKGSRYYYFPHKSYIEFLVAQYFSYGRFSVDMYRMFNENVTPEVMSFVEEGPVSGLENLRAGLEHATGEIPRYVVEAAAKDPAIGTELTSKGGANKASASKLYTYYVKYMRDGTDAREFLRGQLAQSSVAGRALALLNCIGDYLKATGDRTLARAVVINCLTTVFDEHKTREYARGKAPAEIYRDDEIAVRAGALLNAVRLFRSRVVVYPDRLMEFAVASSGTTPFVRLWSDGMHREIRLPRDILVSSKVDAVTHSSALVEALLAGVATDGPHGVPIVLRGDAERYLLNRTDAGVAI